MAEISKDLVRKIVTGMHHEGMIKTWLRGKPNGWILADQITWSPFYLNLRQMSSAEPSLYKASIEAMGEIMEKSGFTTDRNAKSVGVAMGGIPLADGVALYYDIPALYTRKLPEEIKTAHDVEIYLTAHGQKALVEGEFSPNNRLCIVDDLVTTLSSKLLAISQVENEAKRRKFAEPINLKHIFVLGDREQGATDKAKALGLELHAAFGFVSDALPILREEGFSNLEYCVINDYLTDPQKYQDKKIQAEVEAMARR